MIGWIIYAIILVAAIMTGVAAWKGAPFVPTPKAAVAAALDLATVNKNDVLVDIGAGDARVLIMAAQRGAKVVGYELSPFLWLLGLSNILLRRAKVSLRLRDGFGADLSNVTVLFLFLMPKTLPRLMEALKNNLRPGTRVVTYAFPISCWQPEKEVKLEGVGKVYLYRVR